MDDGEAKNRSLELNNCSLTGIDPDNVRGDTDEAARQDQMMTLSARDSTAFVEALLNPPAPGERLRAAAQVHRDLIGS